MTFDPEKPVQTRNGRKVEIIKTGMNSHESIVAVVTSENGEESAETYSESGAYHKGESDWDLINIPEEYEILVYLLKGFHSVTTINSPNDTIASKRITFTEGEFEE